ncbi:MAG TPA: biotin transporter BioY [Clostridia bacterium]|nr:biotin transporter BioY [Clostridia bacterium]
MAKAATYGNLADRSLVLTKQTAIVVGASLAIAICARISVPLPFTPVPLTLANFAVLAVGLLLGSKRGFAAAALYLAQGAAGMPVFSPAGPGGLAQLLGPTGGYLIGYPVAAFVAGWVAEHGRKSFSGKLLAACAAELVLFAAGVSWLMILTGTPAPVAVGFGLYPFIFGEIMKVTSAAGLAMKFNTRSK